MNKKYVYLLSIAILSIMFTSNLCGQSVLLRGNSSIGGFFSKESRGLSYSYGLKTMLKANDKQRYGIEVDNLVFVHNANSNSSFLRIGIFLEQVLYKYFNMGIGTVGYIDLSDKESNPFGIYSHLGFEYPFCKRYHFLLGYENDFIFRKQLMTNASFMFGIGMKF
jgi:hypothetical protein